MVAAVLRTAAIICRLPPCATRSVGGHAPRYERPPAMPESLKSGVASRIVCRLPLCATLACEKRLPLTAPPHNPHYDRLCVTFRGRLGRLYGLGLSYGCRPRNVTQSKYIHIYHNVYVLYVSGRRQTFCSCGLPSSELMCVHALYALLRPLLGQAPNPESGLTVVFCARCGLTSSRAYVLSGGCSALAGGRSALLRPPVGSFGGSPLKPPVLV